MKGKKNQCDINLVHCQYCAQHHKVLHYHDTPSLYHIRMNSYCTRNFTIKKLPNLGP